MSETEDARKERLAQALRNNLRKRKAQARQSAPPSAEPRDPD
ncbi:hypothetical protein WG908_04495 [Sphingobium sp. AN641]